MSKKQHILLLSVVLVSGRLCSTKRRSQFCLDLFPFDESLDLPNEHG